MPVSTWFSNNSSAGQRWVVGLFFGLLALVGVALHRDYGVSWDEPTDHLNGLVNVKYMAELVFPEKVGQDPSVHQIPPLKGYPDNDHGVVFEIPVTVLSYLFTHHDPQAYYYMRHLLIFGTFLLGIWSTYQIGRIRFQDWRLALLAAFLLVLSPRIFAEGFYNGKDILFLGLFTLGMATLVRLKERPTYLRAVVHGTAIGLAVDARILGSLLGPFTLGLLLLDWPWLAAPERQQRARLLGISVAVAVVTTVVGWPYLWEDPVGNFAAAFRSMSHFKWSLTNYYFGQAYKANALPWHYIPVWIILTTPVSYVLAACVGVVGVTAHSIKTGWLALRNAKTQFDLLLLGWLLGPILLVIVLHSSLYDTWRHLYFVYPALVLLAVRGLLALAGAARQHQRWHNLALGLGLLASFETLYTFVRMVRMHPFQNLYYSFLPAPTVEALFERDHWGVAYRRGVEWLLQNQPQGPITFSTRLPLVAPVYNNSLILKAQQRQRIQYVPLEQANYFITSYRWHPQSYTDSVGTEIYTLRVEGIKVLSIFRLPRP
ncbi:hypothetical protein GCM10027346_17280 [Hymenobacter seoulensis]